MLHEVKLEPSINSVNPNTQDKLLSKIQENYLLQKSLISDYGLTLRNANKIIKDYPIPYIKESLEIIRLKKIHGTIKNIPAYTLTVLKNDYENISKTKQKLEPKQNQKIQSKISEQTSSLMSCSNSSSTQKKARESFTKLSKVEQEKLIKKFEDEKIYGLFFETKYKNE